MGTMGKRKRKPLGCVGLPVLDLEQSCQIRKSARRYIKSVREEGSRQRTVSHRKKATQYIDSTPFPGKGSLGISHLPFSHTVLQLWRQKKWLFQNHQEN
jgi:hypothetical protein